MVAQLFVIKAGIRLLEYEQPGLEQNLETGNNENLSVLAAKNIRK